MVVTAISLLNKSSKEEALPCDAVGVVVISTAQLHAIKPDVRFCGSSNPALHVLEVCCGENLRQYFWLCRSTISQN